MTPIPDHTKEELQTLLERYNIRSHLAAIVESAERTGPDKTYRPEDTPLVRFPATTQAPDLYYTQGDSDDYRP